MSFFARVKLGDLSRVWREGDTINSLPSGEGKRAERKQITLTLSIPY